MLHLSFAQRVQPSIHHQRVTSQESLIQACFNRYRNTHGYSVARDIRANFANPEKSQIEFIGL